MLLKHAVGHLAVAQAARAEAGDVAVTCDPAPQQLLRTSTTHAAVLHSLACAQQQQHQQQQQPA
jgi:hypothetical protein